MRLFTGVLVLGLLAGGVAAAEPMMSDAARLNPNVKIALGYVDTVWTGHKPVEGYAAYVAPDSIHHPGGPGASKPEKLAELVAQFPNFTYHVKQVFADGDYVVLHSMLTGVPGEGQPVAPPFPGAPSKPKVGDEVVDIFRIVNGKIVEHWDVVEPVSGTADGFF